MMKVYPSFMEWLESVVDSGNESQWIMPDVSHMPAPIKPPDTIEWYDKMFLCEWNTRIDGPVFEEYHTDRNRWIYTYFAPDNDKSTMRPEEFAQMYFITQLEDYVQPRPWLQKLLPSKIQKIKTRC